MNINLVNHLINSAIFTIPLLGSINKVKKVLKLLQHSFHLDFTSPLILFVSLTFTFKAVPVYYRLLG